MNKLVDEKFFEFIGINANKFNQRISQIEKICGVKSISEHSEEEVRYMLIEYLKRNYLSISPDLPILKNVREYIEDVYTYGRDIDTALYMLIGSYYSDWEKIFPICKNLPFSIINNRCVKWCKPIRVVFENINEMSLLNEIDEKTRVEKYSYLNMRKLYQEVEGAILVLRPSQPDFQLI